MRHEKNPIQKLRIKREYEDKLLQKYKAKVQYAFQGEMKQVENSSAYEVNKLVLRWKSNREV